MKLGWYLKCMVLKREEVKALGEENVHATVNTPLYLSKGA